MRALAKEKPLEFATALCMMVLAVLFVRDDALRQQQQQRDDALRQEQQQRDDALRQEQQQRDAAFRQEQQQNFERLLLSDDIPGFVFFLPLAFGTEGYHTTDLTKLLYGFAMKRATADGWDGAAAKKRACWCDFWLNQFAMKHARFTSRCVLHRASVCKDAANPSFRRASVVDVSLGSSMLLPRKPPPPPPPPLPGTASAAAAAPAR